MRNDSKAKEADKKEWEEPTLRKVGTVGEVLRGGGGKLSVMADDSGDAPRKPKGQG